MPDDIFDRRDYFLVRQIHATSLGRHVAGVSLQTLQCMLVEKYRALSDARLPGCHVTGRRCTPNARSVARNTGDVVDLRPGHHLSRRFGCRDLNRNIFFQGLPSYRNPAEWPNVLKHGRLMFRIIAAGAISVELADNAEQGKKSRGNTNCSYRNNRGPINRALIWISQFALDSFFDRTGPLRSGKRGRKYKG